MPENNLPEEENQQQPEQQNAQPDAQMQPNPHITNPVLVDAMATFKVDLTNTEHERAFLQAAIDAKYLIPALIERPVTQTPDGEPVPTRIAFQMMTNPNGDKFMPAFTDEIELRKNRKPGEHFQVAVMGFMDLYRFVKNNEAIFGVVINPFGSNLCLIRRQVIMIGDANGDLDAVAATIQKQMESKHVTNSLGVASGTREENQAAIRQAMEKLEAQKNDENAEPEKEVITDDLLGAVKGCLKKCKAVKKAYIGKASESGENYLLIAVEADESADLTEIGNTISTECADYSDLPFECVAASNIRAKQIVESEKPFYEKKRFGIF